MGGMDTTLGKVCIKTSCQNIIYETRVIDVDGVKHTVRIKETSDRIFKNEETKETQEKEEEEAGNSDGNGGESSEDEILSSEFYSDEEVEESVADGGFNASNHEKENKHGSVGHAMESMDSRVSDTIEEEGIEKKGKNSEGGKNLITLEQKGGNSKWGEVDSGHAKYEPIIVGQKSMYDEDRDPEIYGIISSKLKKLLTRPKREGEQEATEAKKTKVSKNHERKKSLSPRVTRSKTKNSREEWKKIELERRKKGEKEDVKHQLLGDAESEKTQEIGSACGLFKNSGAYTLGGGDGGKKGAAGTS